MLLVGAANLADKVRSNSHEIGLDLTTDDTNIKSSDRDVSLSTNRSYLP